MAVLLDCGLVEYPNIADLVESMIKSVDLNGPAECDDSSTTLWTVLLVLRGREHLSTASEPFDSILRWLFGRWSPGLLSWFLSAIFWLTTPQPKCKIAITRCT